MKTLNTSGIPLPAGFVTHPLPSEGHWGNDICHGFFDVMYGEGRVPIPHGARVLVVGCAEADFVTPLKALRPDLHITAFDQRTCSERPGADVFLQGDVLNASLFPVASFEVIIACSVIEHVGVNRYGAPVDPDGDTHAMANIHRWLTPDGVFYLDVPYRPEGPSTEFRQYNEADLQRRVIGTWKEIDREYFHPNHPDGPYVALVLKP